MVVATTFASNVARLKTLAEAGRAAGRQVVVLGRAMNTMLKTAACRRGARRTSRRSSTRSTPTACRAASCWCSPPAARASAAPPRRSSPQGKYHGLRARSPATPSCSRRRRSPATRCAVARILNQLSEKGVTRHRRRATGSTTSRGHANRPDLVTLQELVRPQMLVPMHGEHRHLSAHAALGRGARASPAAVAPNGTMLDLTGDGAAGGRACRDRAGLSRRHAC